MSPTAFDILFNAGIADSHWGVRIIAAEDKGYFAESDVHDSKSWVTCACGKNSRLIETAGDITGDDDDKCPLDPVIVKLGMDFPSEVGNDDFVNAARTLVAIENRAIELSYGLRGN